MIETYSEAFFGQYWGNIFQKIATFLHLPIADIKRGLLITEWQCHRVTIKKLNQ
jgi:hypothetical protein